MQSRLTEHNLSSYACLRSSSVTHGPLNSPYIAHDTGYLLQLLVPSIALFCLPASRITCLIMLL